MIQVFAKDLSEAESLVKEFRSKGFLSQILEVYYRKDKKEFNYKVIVGGEIND